MVDCIEIDGIMRNYLIERKATKTIKFSVFPDMTLKIIAPIKMSEDEIQLRLNKRYDWLKKTFTYYSNIIQESEIEYKSGSTIRYLGKQYRLKLNENDRESIKLIGKYLEINVRSKEIERIKKLVDEWYRVHSISYFNKIVKKCLLKLNKYGVNEPNIFVRKMKSRWGSCTKNKNKVILNSNLIRESSQSIEYVIMHELCHLKYANHNIQFYTFFSIVMPDWKSRKNKLEKYHK